MRLFVAVDVDDQTRAQLAISRNAIEEIVNAARVPPRVTWVNPDRAHVTVRFIGETAEQHLDAIQRALSTIAIEPFEVTWEAVGAFGGMRNPRVIWIAPTTGLEAFGKLAGQVNALLDPLIGPGETRAFKPHLTLGRVRDSGRNIDWRRALEAVRFSPTVSRVDHITLYQSRLSPKGPTYTAISTHG